EAVSKQFSLGDGHVEVYDQARYFTVTGQHWMGQMLEVEDHQADIEWLLGLSPSGLKKVRFGIEAADGKIQKGEQHNTLVRFAGLLRGAGADSEVIEAALLAMNRSQCTEPGPDEHIRQIAASAGRWERGT